MQQKAMMLQGPEAELRVALAAALAPRLANHCAAADLDKELNAPRHTRRPECHQLRDIVPYKLLGKDDSPWSLIANNETNDDLSETLIAFLCNTPDKRSAYRFPHVEWSIATVSLTYCITLLTLRNRMTNHSIWMVRAGKNAAAVDDFVEGNFVGIGFQSAGDVTIPIDRSTLEACIAQTHPSFSPGKIGSVASQVKRFYEELSVGDAVMTYDSSQRLYFLGEILSDVQTRQHDLGRARSVRWTKQVNRDSLAASTRNTLGAIQTLFLVREEAAADVWANAVDIGSVIDTISTTTDTAAGAADESLEDIEARASELIDDRIAGLAWDDLQQLVAEILEAMGYRAEVSSAGPDRGIDIFASPDGLGLQEPRIFVEVKHRLGTRISSDLIRAFIGGRQTGDRCLYVSTGGFSKEAKYEAERSNIPVTLIDLPKLRALVLEHYPKFSPSGLSLLPLKQMYWPVA
jgi:restriction system protein